MYDYFKGTVARRSAASVVIDAGGVGYELCVPLGTDLAPVGESALVWVHFAVREDSQTLYGFGDRESRDLFRHLLRVRGVGPTMALAVLSGLPRRDLVEAILAEDLARLTRVKGVGKKTAEQILLDLRDKAPAWAEGLGVGTDVEIPRPVSAPASGNVEDAISALVSLGFSEKDARKRVARAAQDIDPNDLNRLVQAAFQG